MKKVLLSLAFAALLLSSCGSDENVPTPSGAGELKTTIKFDGLTQKASSAAIPVTRWSNVNKLQLFLYDSNGKVAFSDIVNPATAVTSGTDDKTFTWLNIPEGTYSLALVANVKSNEDPNVSTSLDGGVSWTSFTGSNVVNKILNTDLFIDLKKLTSFPTSHVIPSTRELYNVAPEVFTAYAPTTVTITKGTTQTLGSNLELKREISLMRVRIDREDKTDAPQLHLVKFDHADNFIAIENQPVGLGVKASSFAGGIYATPSNKNRVIIGASGINTFFDQDPAAADYNPIGIVGAPFTLWQDIRVLPNATKAENIAPDKDAPADRKYKIVIVGWAPAGYVFDDNVTVSTGQPVYWYGTINGVFSPNVIREVNMTIKTAGKPVYPEIIPEVGGLEIVVGAPEQWNQNIQSENMDV